MGNIPTPYESFPVNASISPIERKILLSKITSLSACIVGTSVYLRPTEPYFGAEYFGLLMPAFTTGYILISSSEIFMIFTGYSHTFLEECFAIIGALGSSICGVYELYRWVDWIAITWSDIEKDYGSQEFILALSCLLNSAALLTVFIFREMEKRCVQSNEQ